MRSRSWSDRVRDASTKPVALEDSVHAHDRRPAGTARAARALWRRDDDRDWEALHRIFTDDAVFDLTDLGVPLLVGIEEIKRFMDEDARHPRTHMMTNIYVDETDDGVKLAFRIVALQPKGLTGTASYYDDVVKTPDGWRVRHRVTTLRRRPR
ncbi:MAG: nuclear transport factor 2 family protein [Acidimicrobiales bacterium]